MRKFLNYADDEKIVVVQNPYAPQILKELNTIAYDMNADINWVQQNAMTNGIKLPEYIKDEKFDVFIIDGEDMQKFDEATCAVKGHPMRDFLYDFTSSLAALWTFGNEHAMKKLAALNEYSQSDFNDFLKGKDVLELKGNLSQDLGELVD